MSAGAPKPHFEQVAILGVGLLGGSLGIALQRRKIADRVIGYGRDAKRLTAARQHPEGPVIHEMTTDLSEAVAGADLIICCTPVQHVINLMPQLARAVPPGALVTDVGSTKEAIARAARALTERGADFVGSHPMAGSDRSGVEHASATLYEGSTTFVTVEAETPKNRVAEISGLWRALGSRVVLIHPRRHDHLVANISHLPHLLAVAAVKTVAEVHEDCNVLRWVIGNGFRDTTRIAQGSVPMWNDICATNPNAIVEAIDAFGEHLADLRREIVSSNHRGLGALLEGAREYRAQLENRE